MITAKMVTNKTLLILLLLVGVNACSTLKKWTPFIDNRVLTEHIAITRLEGANNDQYVQVDVAVVFDKSVNSLLLPAQAEQWFADRASFIGMNKKQLRLIAMTPVPISTISEVKLPGNTANARRVLVFIAYHEQDKYFVFDITKQKRVHLILAKKPEIADA